MSRTPYVGLVPYSEEDAQFFFGREQESRMIIANLHASPLTLLYGASGVGKSSVLRAGVTNALQEREDLLVVVFNSWQGDPTKDIMRAVANCAARVDSDAWARASQQLETNPEISLCDFLQLCATELNRRTMIILDQFEEYFLYHSLDDEFAHEFPKAVTQSDTPVSFLISIREDALAKLDRFEGSIPGLFNNYMRIEHLGQEAGMVAITKPIEQYNLRYARDEHPFRVEPQLVQAVLEQVTTGQVILGETGRGGVRKQASAQIETPFLQMVMTRLWDEEQAAQSPVLRLQTLQQLGGVSHIVITHLDRVMASLSEIDCRIAAEAFSYLVTPSGSKIAHTVSDLRAYTQIEATALEQVLDKLTEQRIIRSVPPPPNMPDDLRYEIFHDMLGPSVLDWRARYLRAEETAEAKRQIAAEARAAEQARFARRLKGLIAVATMLLVFTGMAAAFAIRKGREAIAKDREAQASEQRAKDSQRHAEDETIRANSQTSKAALNLEVAKRQEGIANAARLTAEAAQLRAEVEAAHAKRLLIVANEAKKSAEDLRHRADELSRVSRLLLEGFDLKEDRDTAAALEKYKAALQIAEAIGDRDRQAQILRSLALVWDAKKDSELSYQQALEIYRANGDSKNEADTLRELGNLFSRDHADLSKAASYYEIALGLYRRQRNGKDEISTLEKLAALYGSHPERTDDDAVKSIELYEKVLSLYSAGHDYEGAANTLERLGDLHSTLVGGQRQGVAKRIEFYQRAAAVYHEAHKFDEEAFEILQMIGFVYFLDDRDPAWLIDLMKQRSLALRAAGRWEDVAKEIAGIGDIMDQWLSKKEEAVKYLEDARKEFHDLANWTGEGIIVTKIGDLYRVSKQQPKAVAMYETAAALFRSAKNPTGEAQAEAAIGRTWGELDDTTRAIEHYEKARMLGSEAWVLEQLIYLYEKVGDSGKAAEVRKQYDALRAPKRP